MRSKVVPISLPESLLDEADKLAKKESRSRSEFFREAIRAQILKKELDELKRYGRAQAEKLGITEDDVPRLVKEVRQEMKHEHRSWYECYSIGSGFWWKAKTYYRFNQDKPELEIVENLLRNVFTLVTVKAKPTISRDPDDDHILAITHAAKIDYIVSGDKDLLSLSEYKGVPIVTPDHIFAISAELGNL